MSIDPIRRFEFNNVLSFDTLCTSTIQTEQGGDVLCTAIYRPLDLLKKDGDQCYHHTFIIVFNMFAIGVTVSKMMQASRFRQVRRCSWRRERRSSQANVVFVHRIDVLIFSAVPYVIFRFPAG